MRSTRLPLRSRPDPSGVGSVRSELISALSFGVDVISGMHNFLSTDKELLNIAKKNKAKIIDLRKPPSPPHFPEGTWKNRSTPVLLVVGSDCDTGKMTTAWEIKERLSAYNKNIEFIGTGQTGILLSKGVAIDAVVADFMAGEVEYLIDKHKTNFKGVGQPLRIALTGSKFGPGIYDIILSLNKNETIKRLKTIN